MASRLGLHLPNDHLLPGELDRILALGCSEYVIYVADMSDLDYWSSIATILRGAGRAVRIHVRLEWRGPLVDPLAEAKLLSEVIDRFGIGGTTYRVRNESNLESGATPESWRAHLVTFGREIKRLQTEASVFAPAVSPGTRDWREWLMATVNAVEEAGLAGIDAHAYGNPTELADTLCGFRKAWGGKAVLTETNFGAGRQYDLDRYADELMATAVIAAEWNLPSPCVFIWRWKHPDMTLPTPVDVAGSAIEGAIREINWRPQEPPKGSVPVTGYNGATWKASPNFGYNNKGEGAPGTKGRNGHKIVGVVFHIAEGYASGLDSMAQAKDSVNGHYGVMKNGAITQYVDELDAAYGCGLTNKPDLSNPFIADAMKNGVNPNLIFINVECEGFTGKPWGEAQYQSLLRLTVDLCKRYSLSPDRQRLLGHYKLDSVSRKEDPGPTFPWVRLMADVQAALKPKPVVDPVTDSFNGVIHWANQAKAATDLPQSRQYITELLKEVAELKVALGR